MNEDILELPIVIEKASLKKRETVIDVKATELIPRRTIDKRFGIVDLWNIRRKGRRFSIYGT